MKCLGGAEQLSVEIVLTNGADTRQTLPHDTVHLDAEVMLTPFAQDAAEQGRTLTTRIGTPLLALRSHHRAGTNAKPLTLNDEHECIGSYLTKLATHSATITEPERHTFTAGA